MKKYNFNRLNDVSPSRSKIIQDNPTTSKHICLLVPYHLAIAFFVKYSLSADDYGAEEEEYDDVKYDSTGGEISLSEGHHVRHSGAGSKHHQTNENTDRDLNRGL